MKKLENWTVVEEKVLLEDRWLRLRSQVCKTSEGAVIEPFYLSDTSDWVLIIARNLAGKFILIDHYRHGAGEVIREFPAGCFDPGEENPVTVARRELQEETGHHGGEFFFLRDYPSNPHNLTARFHIVLAKDVLEGVAADDPMERVVVQSMTFAEFDTAVFDGKIVHPHHLAGWLLAREHAFFAA